MAVDTFQGDTLDAAWTFVDPLADCTATVANGHLTVSLPGGVTHDSITTANNAPRIVRDAPDGDWTLVASFKSVVRLEPATYGHGIVVCDGSDDVFIRADVYSTSGNTARLFCRDLSTIHISNVAVPNGSLGSSPCHLRLAKSGTTYTFSTSNNGIDWTQQAQFTNATAAPRVGVHAINAGGPAPAYAMKLARFADDGSLPAEPAEPSGFTAVFEDDFAAGTIGAALSASDWTDASVSDGATEYGDGTALFSISTTQGGAARANTTSSSVANARLTGRFKWSATTGDFAYMTIGVRGSGTWGDVYSNVNSYAVEFSQINNKLRLMRVTDAGTPTLDDAYHILAEDDTGVYEPTTNWNRFTLDAQGPWIRMKVWPEAGAEPSEWTWKAIDYSVDQGGVGLALGANWANATPTALSVEFDDIVISTPAAGIIASLFSPQTSMSVGVRL